MPTSPAGRGEETGFTLVELMIVITVIALASAAVALAIPDPRGRLADEAAHFASRVEAAHDAAVVGGRPVSLWVAAGGYGFDERAGGQWRPLGQALGVTRWKDGTRLGLAVAGRLRVTFDETGLADRPLDVPLLRDRATAHVLIAADGSARVDD